MTVVDVDGLEVTCRWFEGAAVKEGLFPAVSIAKAALPENVSVSV
jgi:uncharacterized protein YodC (DUF2158 family)